MSSKVSGFQDKKWESLENYDKIVEGNLYIGEKLCLKSKKISVLMSVYIKENPIFLKDAIESVQNQTLKPSELVLVEDGPLTPELYQVLDQLEAESDIPVKRYPLEQNQGLGLALRQGVFAVSVRYHRSYGYR